MRLVEGAGAIGSDLPSTATVVVEVPLEAGEAQDSKVARFTSLQLVRDRQAQALAAIDGPVITIGGDCGVELASVSHLIDRADAAEKVALVWFDAHPDLNTPETSPSTAFSGMVLRTLLGEGAPGLVPARALDTASVILVGARSLDPAEADYIAESGLASLTAADATVESVAAAISATGATSVYIHLDLDVLDPAEFLGLGYPEPFGIGTTELIAILKSIVAKFTLAGAGITEFAPASAESAEDDLPTILRIIGALTS
jgi:arginase